VNDHDAQRIRLRSEIEECGRDRIGRCVLKQDDPFTIYALLAGGRAINMIGLWPTWRYSENGLFCERV
jgi:hypothetical protein